MYSIIQVILESRKYNWTFIFGIPFIQYYTDSNAMSLVYDHLAAYTFKAEIIVLPSKACFPDSYEYCFLVPIVSVGNNALLM